MEYLPRGRFSGWPWPSLDPALAQRKEVTGNTDGEDGCRFLQQKPAPPSFQDTLRQYGLICALQPEGHGQ